MFERVRVTIERYDSVKVNTTFNGEFATNNKRDIYSINTKNIEIKICASDTSSMSSMSTFKKSVAQ